MTHKNIYITMLVNDQIENHTYAEGSVAIDPTGFIVIDADNQRDFYDIALVVKWGYGIEEEKPKATLSLATDNTLN